MNDNTFFVKPHLWQKILCGCIILPISGVLAAVIPKAIKSGLVYSVIFGVIILVLAYSAVNYIFFEKMQVDETGIKRGSRELSFSEIEMIKLPYANKTKVLIYADGRTAMATDCSYENFRRFCKAAAENGVKMDSLLFLKYGK